MKTLITGANGFLGAHLAKALVARGDAVRCLVRRGADVSALEGVACEQVIGDVTDTASLGPAMAGVEVVFHLAGVRRAPNREGFFRVNATATQWVAEAMVAAKVRRLVFCGSLGASGPAGLDRPRLESDPLEPQEWYGESKAEGERLAFTFSDRLEVTSCRPSRIMGPMDHENLPFFKLAKRGLVLKLLGPERRLSLVDVDDVVQQLMLQADAKAAVGEAFFATSNETMSIEGLMREVAAYLHVDARTVPVPPLALRGLGALADLVSNTTGKNLALNRKLVRQLLVPGWVCSNEKARRVLGYAPRRTVRESIERSAASYVQAGWL